MPKALLLFSGGLDSILAAKLLEEQGVDTTALCFSSNFFTAAKAEEAALKYGFDLRIEDISPDELALVKNPLHGYGKNMNPCLDCHAMMIRKAGELARTEKFDFVATGEVLGQRPFSQNRRALAQVEEISGIEVLRPLTAKNLPETEIEKKGLVKRALLQAIKGRQRDRQFELARRFGISDFPSPSGGCLLTDPEYSERLMKMLEYWPQCGCDDVSLLSYGRVFWLRNKPKTHVILVIGRNHDDNEALKGLAKKGDIMVELKEENGPTALIRTNIVKNKNDENADIAREATVKVPVELRMSSCNLGEIKSLEEIIGTASLLTAYYAVKLRGKKAVVIIKSI